MRDRQSTSEPPGKRQRTAAPVAARPAIGATTRVQQLAPAPGPAPAGSSTAAAPGASASPGVDPDPEALAGVLAGAGAAAADPTRDEAVIAFGGPTGQLRIGEAIERIGVARGIVSSMVFERIGTGYTKESGAAYTRWARAASRGPSLGFDTEEAFFTWLEAEGVLVRAGGGGPVNHHVRGGPSDLGRFSQRTSTAVPLAASGHHRRHVIGRHTLWQAVDRARGTSGADTAAVDAFVAAHGAGARGGNAWERAYSILQDTVGNLWSGDGAQNSAIGFFTGDLFNAVAGLLGGASAAPAPADAMDVDPAPDGAGPSTAAGPAPAAPGASDTLALDAILAAIDGIQPKFANLAAEYARLKQILKEHAASIDVDGQVDAGAFLELATDFGRNLELDPPHGDEAEHESWRQLFERVSTSSQIFADGTAAAFMAHAHAHPAAGGAPST
jgi:hypothetical protein